MNKAKNLSLFIAVIFWATLIGGIMYSHLVFFPAYLRNLPGSTSLVHGPYAIVDERFWMNIHPLLILSLVAATLLNWKVAERRKYLLAAVGIYVAVLIVSFSFFVPELLAFAESHKSTIAPAEWMERGKRWEQLSWVRGAFMYLGFGLLLTALVKNRVEVKKSSKREITSPELKKLEAALNRN